MDREKNENKGFGFVTFTKSSDAARALEESDPCKKHINFILNNKLQFNN